MLGLKPSAARARNALALCLSIGRLFGLYPFASSRPRLLAIRSYSIAFFALFTYTYVYVMVYFRYADRDWYKNTFNLYLTYLEMTLHFTSGIVSGLTPFLRHNTFLAILKNLRKCEDAQAKLKFPVVYQLKWYVLYCCGPLMAVASILSIDFLFYLCQLKGNSLPETTLRYLSVVIVYLTKAQCLSLLKLAADNFSSLTERVRTISKLYFVSKTDEKDTFIQLYDSLIDTCQAINRMYSVHMLMSVGTVFGLTTALLYQLYRNLVMRDRFMIGYFATTLLRVFLHVADIWSTVHVPFATRRKAEEFNTALYKLMVEDKTGEIYRNEKFYLHIAMKREVVFTACGFFTLDYTLIQSMIGAAATFLVILIQFDISQASIHNNCTAEAS